MNLFIHGVQFRNKGAHLMLQAVREEVAKWPRQVSLVMDPRKGTRRQRNQMGVYDHAWYESHRFPAAGSGGGAIANLLPSRLLRTAGFVADKDIDGVLDASGFSYSDQWGVGGVERMVRRCSRWKRRGLPIVLLPQAFGPFSTENIRRAFRDLVELVDLVYLRDEQSASYVRQLGVPVEKLRQAPDFTCLVQGRTRDVHDRLLGRACLIPNYRMVDKTEGDTATAYIDFLVGCARRTIERGVEPFVLIHDQGRDRELVSAVESRLGSTLEVVVEDDPVHVKGLVGRSIFVVGSRFHGIVSALTQGVPCIGTSWSHKYEELFRSFGCEALLVGRHGLGRPREQDEMLDLILDGGERQRLSTRLRETARIHVARTRDMWEEVREAFGLSGTPSSRTAA